METAACSHYWWVNVDTQKHTEEAKSQGRHSIEKEIEKAVGNSPEPSSPEVGRDMG